MLRLTGFALLLTVFAVDVASAQTLRYVDGSNPGASQLSNHRYFMGSQLRSQNRRFGYQMDAAHRQRASLLNMRNIQRLAGNRGTRTGTAAEAVAQKRQEARDHLTVGRMAPIIKTTRLQTITVQREAAKRKVAQRATKRKSRTLNW